MEVGEEVLASPLATGMPPTGEGRVGTPGTLCSCTDANLIKISKMIKGFHPFWEIIILLLKKSY